MHFVRTLAVLLASHCLTLHAVQADTIVVPLGGDIQAAIDSASAGDTIQLEEGTYEIFETLVIDKPLLLAGAGSSKAGPLSTIDAGRRCRVMHAVAATDLSHLALANGLIGFDGDEAPDPDGSPCDFRYQTTDSGEFDGGGILAYASVVLDHCRIQGCRSGTRGGGIYATDTAEEIKATNTVFFDNRATAGGAISDDFPTGGGRVVLRLESCRLEGQRACSGAAVATYSGLDLKDCLVSDCIGGGIFFSPLPGQPIAIRSTVIRDNHDAGLDYGSADYDISSDSCICRSSADNNQDGLPDECEGQDLTIAQLIRHAIEAGNESVTLPPGEFRLAGPISLPQTTNLTIQGDPDSGTVLSGRGVVQAFLLSHSSGITVQDLTISDGFGYRGGGIASIFGSDISLNQARLQDCSTGQADFAAGGAIFELGWGSLSLTDTVFDGCRAPRGDAIALGQAAATQIIANRVDFLAAPTTLAGSVVSCSLQSDSTAHTFTSCLWNLDSAPQRTAIDADVTGPQKLTASLQDCVLLYEGQPRRVVIAGTRFWDATNCTFSSCCPFEWTPSNTVAYAGGTLDIFRCEGCLGDVTCDGVTDAADLGRLLSGYATTEPRYDLDENGIVDGSDLGVMLTSWGICQ